MYKQISSIEELPVHKNEAVIYIFDIEVIASLEIKYKYPFLNENKQMVQWIKNNCSNVVCLYDVVSYERLIRNRKDHVCIIEEQINKLKLPFSLSSNELFIKHETIGYFIPYKVWNIAFFDWSNLVFVSNKSDHLAHVHRLLPKVECYLLYN